jgi:hypothetical protein
MERTGQELFAASSAGLMRSLFFFWRDSFFRLHSTPTPSSTQIPILGIRPSGRNRCPECFRGTSSGLMRGLGQPSIRAAAGAADSPRVNFHGQYQYENADESRTPGAVNTGSLTWNGPYEHAPKRAALPLPASPRSG